MVFSTLNKKKQKKSQIILTQLRTGTQYSTNINQHHLMYTPHELASVCDICHAQIYFINIFEHGKYHILRPAHEVYALNDVGLYLYCTVFQFSVE